MSLRSIHVAACVRMPFLCKAKRISFTHLSVDGHLSGSQLSAARNHAAVNVDTQLSVPVPAFHSRRVLRSGSAGLYGNSHLISWGISTVFHSWLHHLTLSPAIYKVPIFLYLCNTCYVLFFLGGGVGWHFILFWWQPHCRCDPQWFCKLKVKVLQWPMVTWPPAPLAFPLCPHCLSHHQPFASSSSLGYIRQGLTSALALPSTWMLFPQMSVWLSPSTSSKVMLKCQLFRDPTLTTLFRTTTCARNTHSTPYSASSHCTYHFIFFNLFYF